MLWGESKGYANWQQYQADLNSRISAGRNVNRVLEEYQAEKKVEEDREAALRIASAQRQSGVRFGPSNQQSVAGNLLGNLVSNALNPR
jgi:hypothetical protein